MNLVTGVKVSTISKSLSAIQCHWHEQIDYTPKVLKYILWYEVCPFNQTPFKIIKNFPNCISQVKAYNATTFFTFFDFLFAAIYHMGKKNYGKPTFC